MVNVKLWRNVTDDLLRPTNIVQWTTQMSGSEMTWVRRGFVKWDCPYTRSWNVCFSFLFSPCEIDMNQCVDWVLSVIFWILVSIFYDILYIYNFVHAVLGIRRSTRDVPITFRRRRRLSQIERIQGFTWSLRVCRRRSCNMKPAKLLLLSQRLKS